MSKLKDCEVMFGDVLCVRCEGNVLVFADRYYSGEALVDWLLGCVATPAFVSYCGAHQHETTIGTAGAQHFLTGTGTLRACGYSVDMPYLATLEGWEVFKVGVRRFCAGLTDSDIDRHLHVFAGYFSASMSRRDYAAGVPREKLCPCIECVRALMRQRQTARRHARDVSGMRVYRNRERAERLIMELWGNRRYSTRNRFLREFMNLSATVVDCHHLRCYLWETEASQVYVGGEYVWLPDSPDTLEVEEVQAYYSGSYDISWRRLNGWEVSDVEYDEDSEDGDGSNDIPDYHSVSRPWRHRTIQPYEIGIEVETYCENRGALAEEVRGITSAFNESCLAERDSSLDRDCGIESVTPPTYLEDAKRLAVELSDTLRVHVARVPNSEYGLHVSICTHEWSILHLGKFEAFLNVNQDVCELIARRARNHWCQTLEGGFPGRVQRFKRYARFDKSRGRNMITEMLHSTSGHYDLVQLGSSGRAEVRMFRSSTKAINLVGAIEFVHAVASYTRDCSVSQTADGGVCDLPAFWRFCWERRKRDYPNLFKYALECGVDTSLPIRADRLEKIQKSGVVA